MEGSTMVEKVKLFARVKEVRAISEACGIKGHEGAPGEASMQQYERILKRDVMSEGQAMEGVSRASWRVHRAALLWGYKARFERLLKTCSDRQKADDLEGASEAIEAAGDAAERWMAVRDAQKPQDGPRRKSKRSQLPKETEWRRDVWRTAREAERPGVAVCWAAGLRPWELEQGVDVEIGDDRTILVRIPGAKVSERTQAGQPWRVVSIDRTSLAGKALERALEGRTTIRVQVDRRALEWTLERLGKVLEHRHPLTGYTFRHQAAADAKGAGLGAEEVAAVLGHASTRSQKAYGTAKQARGGAIKGALAAKPVRKVQDTGASLRPK